MRRTVRYILATSNPMGDLEALEKFVKLAPDTGADAIALIGNLMPKAANSKRRVTEENGAESAAERPDAERSKRPNVSVLRNVNAQDPGKTGTR